MLTLSLFRRTPFSAAVMAADDPEQTMRKESVAEGIKRRMAARKADQRKRMHGAVQLAIWGGVVGFVVMAIAGALTTWPR